MSKSVLLKSSIAKKYWMAFTGLFLCLFLVGHLLGNLQLFAGGEEGRRAFNEYAYFMQHNPLIKVMSYVTYLSILFHAIDGILLAFQNKKARPIQYAMENAASNSSSASRKMAILGSIILIFIATHMVNFWAKMHFGGLQLHTVTKTMEDQNVGQDPTTGQPIQKDIVVEYVLTTKGDYQQFSYVHPFTGKKEVALDIKDETNLYDKTTKLKVAEGYKDLHTAVMTFFGKDAQGQKKNEYALIAILFYTLSMAVLSFHLLHGFAAAFQTLGLRHPRYTPIIKMFGTIFAIVVPALFALIPLYIFIS
jgi:succinate dehydrogenase / fumarate reductase, cytochrome b subunit